MARISKKSPPPPNPFEFEKVKHKVPDMKNQRLIRRAMKNLGILTLSFFKAVLRFSSVPIQPVDNKSPINLFFVLTPAC